MNNKYICIHGHFYQPPREHAWLEVVEQQDSAYPFHDWNERITSECYGPNSASRIKNEHGKIINIVNNYSNISFNVGPTLFDWLEKNAPDIYNSIIEADQMSMDHFGGYGSAIAQVYNHIIMPLANRRDKETQVKWGIRDFELRFGRKPEGMWLAESAVDTETLEVLAEQHIKFTILAPRQAKEVKAPGSKVWKSVDEGSVDTKRPYLCKLPSGNTIALFFYDARTSQAVAFEKLLASGEKFANSLMEGFDASEEETQLIHIATDGETYGHHEKHGDMALAYCLHYIEDKQMAKITNYAQFLSLFPPEHEARIHENSSWSCVHGVERWKSNCGCKAGRGHNYHQEWRAPLRKALDWLRDELATIFETKIREFVDQPWEVRNDYISVVLSRKKKNVSRFISKHIDGKLTIIQKNTFLRLLEMQRHAMLMYTSCAWFFDEISDIETVQVLQYASRAIQLAERESDAKLEDKFLSMLENAKSNLPEHRNGKVIFNKFIRPAKLTLSDVAAHYAVSSLFEHNPEKINIWNYKGRSKVFERLEAGFQRLAIGKTRVDSKITYSSKEFVFTVLYLGQHNIIGNMSVDMKEADFNRMMIEISDAFNDGRLYDVIGLMYQYFGEQKFSIWSLFKDEQIKVLNEIISDNVDKAELAVKRIFKQNYNLMNVLKSKNLPVPEIFVQNLTTVINYDLIDFFENGTLHPTALEQLQVEVTKWNTPLNKTEISFAASKRIYHLLKELVDEPNDVKLVTTTARVLKTLRSLEIDLDLWKIRNEYFKASRTYLNEQGKPNFAMKEDRIEPWMKGFSEIGEILGIEVQ